MDAFLSQQLRMLSCSVPVFQLIIKRGKKTNNKQHWRKDKCFGNLRRWNKCKVIAPIFRLLMRWKDWNWRYTVLLPRDILLGCFLGWKTGAVGMWNEIQCWQKDWFLSEQLRGEIYHQLINSPCISYMSTTQKELCSVLSVQSLGALLSWKVDAGEEGAVKKGLCPVLHHSRLHKILLSCDWVVGSLMRRAFSSSHFHHWWWKPKGRNKLSIPQIVWRDV